MRQIDLTDVPIARVEITSSKGNQSKWNIDGKWYKMDCEGYEAFSEFISAEILKKSNISRYASYSLCKIVLHDVPYNGCVSDDFLQDGEELFTLERLVKQKFGFSLMGRLREFDSVEQRVDFTLERLQELGVERAGDYLTALTEIDALLFNGDRHTNNIAFVRKNDGSIIPAPFFDQGNGLFSDLVWHPLHIENDALPTRAAAKPFSGDFDRQKEYLESLFGVQLRFSYTEKDLEKSLSQAEMYYSSQIIQRVRFLMKYQMKKYKELQMD